MHCTHFDAVIGTSFSWRPLKIMQRYQSSHHAEYFQACYVFTAIGTRRGL